MRQDLPKYLEAVYGGEIPTFRVSGEVGTDISGSALASAVIAQDEGDGVRIILETMGGDLNQAFRFYDDIRSEGRKIWVDGRGSVMSAGTIMMAAAGRRRSSMTPNAEYMIHEASGGDADRREDANDKMATIYSELTGRSKREMRALMKAETFMDAKKALEMGFIGFITEHQRLAAQHNDMADKEIVKDKRTFTVTAKQALSALTSGKLELEVDLDKEIADVVASLTTDNKDLTAKLTEAQDEVKVKDEAITAAAEKLTAQEVKTKEEAAKVTALTTERDALKAEVEKLKTTPLAPAVKGAGEDTVDPEKKGEAPKMVKLNADQKAERLAAIMQNMNKPTSK